MPRSTLPIHLTHAESRELRRLIERAIVDARDQFIQTFTVRNARGVVSSGPDPCAIDAEVALILARSLARIDLDVIGIAEGKITRLEAELDRCGDPTKSAFGEGSIDGDEILVDRAAIKLR